MADILHRVGTTAARETVYQALTTVDGLAAWWTTDTEGSGDDVLQFRFGDVGGFDMKVLELQPDTRVRWEVVSGPEEWVGTTVTFDLKQEGEWTIVLFAHEGWREQVEFMNHCTTKWALFLMSLKSLVETGTGAPHPHDVRISNWH
ncbi:SRPBCC family protein [Streptomyces sp. NBC_00328]|uniref:SRPBCC family protein n=1 Tax=Streptomyces sp. NBC_00328 TaxID=2903646 RepID=UPI002E290480|nr:SRPBCC domain-containing protein [Streptomyces sp. NBC_00328]